MKLLAVVLAVLALAAPSAPGQRDSPPDRLVGTWVMVNSRPADGAPFPIKTMTLTFAAGRFSVAAEVETDGRLETATRTGTYVLEDRRLSMHTTKGNLDEVYDVEFRDAQLVLMLQGVVSVTLERLKKPAEKNSLAPALEPFLGKEVTLTGTAEPRKGGAALMGDGFYVWLKGVHFWPDAVVGKKVEVRGRLEEDHGLPVFVHKAGEPHKQGMPVPEGTDVLEESRRLILVNPTWKPAP